MTTPLDKAVEAMAWDRAVEAVTDALDGEQLKWLASSPPNRKALAAAALQAADDLLREHYWGELRERLLGGGGGRSHGQLHNALRSSSPLSGFAAPQPKPDEGEGSVVSGTGSSVEQDTVQGLVEAFAPVPQSGPVVEGEPPLPVPSEELLRAQAIEDYLADARIPRPFPATQPEPQQGVGAGVANRDQVYAALDEHIEKAHAEIIVDILQRRCAGLGWTPDVTATALEIVRALPATQHQEVDVEGAGPTREEFKQALEILALATFEGVPLPDDLVADEYEKHGWLATGRDITDEGFCCLTDAGRDLIGTVLAEAATPPSEQGGEVAE